MSANIEKLQQVISSYFGTSEPIDESTVAADIDGWDSLAHASLMIRVEEEFDVQFPMEAIWKLKNVGEMASLIAKLREGA